MRTLAIIAALGMAQPSLADSDSESRVRVAQAQAQAQADAAQGPAPSPPLRRAVPEDDRPARLDLSALYAAPAVAAPSPFRPGDYHAGHDCPNCGSRWSALEQTTWDGSRHYHTCPACGVAWWHWNPPGG